MNQKERTILSRLDHLLHLEAIRTAIGPIAQRVSKNLSLDHNASMSWEPIPLALYGEALPGGIRSSWVFIMRAGARTGSERHPNSHQRMMSFQGSGDLPTQRQGEWQSNPLISDPHAPLDRRWVSVPKNVWHEVIVPRDSDWVVVSFHTVPAEDLIEERPDPKQAGRTKQMRYWGSEPDRRLNQ